VITSSDSKATRPESWKKPNACSPSRLFPPEATAKWEKEHGRLNRWRIKRVAVTPEEIGLCGCWQVIAVERTRIELTKPAKKAKTDSEEKPAKETKPAAEQKPVTERKPIHETSVEISCYATSLSPEEHDGAALEEIIRGHWSAIENGTHYRRDVTLGEDACRTANRRGAEVLASLRNLALGIYELQRAREKTKVDTLASWCEQQTFSKAWLALRQ
jgi:predicted transposase YbfD/YdcC